VVSVWTRVICVGLVVVGCAGVSFADTVRTESPSEMVIRPEAAVEVRIRSVGGTVSIVSTTATESSGVVPVVGNNYATTSGGMPMAIDVQAPSIGGLMSEGQWIATGDYIGANPNLEIGIQDADSVVSSWNIAIHDHQGATVASASMSGVTQASVTASITVGSALTTGVYTVEVAAWDAGGNYRTKTFSPLKVDTGLRLGSLLSGPNPLNPNQTTGVIEYQLSLAADVEIKILAANGRVVWQQSVGGGQVGGAAGFNRIFWNGRDLTGEVVANGPYLIVVVAKSGSEKVSGRSRLVVVK